MSDAKKGRLLKSVFFLLLLMHAFGERSARAETTADHKSTVPPSITSKASSVASEKSKSTAKVPVKKFSSVSAALAEYAVPVRAKLRPLCKQMNVEYPPTHLTWVCLKQEKMLYIFAKDRKGTSRQLLSYPIIGASGGAGPKLKEGDKQVPEGFYKLDGFRPNVIAHLGLSVNYPNEEDRANAKKDGRSDLGKDILIHGSRWSTGCLAMGNPPIEELFVLTYDVGLKNIDVIFAPCNLLKADPEGLDMAKQPAWLAALYARIKTELKLWNPT